ncbi:MAG TPA: ATP-binding protein, partial [Nitrospiria bacterium]
AIEIANTNSTIPPSDYKRIFDPFYTTKEGGTGLGLAITHQVVTAQGGTIEVESGKGETVFTIELPVK